MIRASLCLAILAASLPVALPASEPGEKPAKIVDQLPGAWQGGDCIGLLILHANGAFERRHHTPGGNKLTGTWQLRETAFPPLLILTTRTSNDPESLPIGKSITHKIMQLDDETLAIEEVGRPCSRPLEYERVKP